MNDDKWTNEPINGVPGVTNTLGKQGCALDLVATIGANANGGNTTPQVLNTQTSTFSETGNIDINWKSAGNNVGLDITRSTVKDTKAAQQLLQEAISSPKNMYVGVQVPITVQGKETPHWVGVNGLPVVDKSGTEYLRVSPTSTHDDLNRTVNSNWKYDKDTGDLLVKSSSVLGTITATTKTNSTLPVDQSKKNK